MKKIVQTTAAILAAFTFGVCLVSCEKAQPTEKETVTTTIPAAATPVWGSAPVKVGIIGDSISTFEGWIPSDYKAYYPHTGSSASLTQVEQTWWHRLIYNLMPDATLDRNLSYSATRVTMVKTPTSRPDADANDFITRCTNFVDPDIIVIAGGTNDRPCVAAGLVGEYDWDTPTEELDRYSFRPAYTRLVQTLRNTYPGAKIVCVVNNLLLTPTNKAIGESIEAIAEHYSLPCAKIEMTLETVGDGVHPSSAGAEYWAKIVHETIRDAGLLNYRKSTHQNAASVLGRELADSEIVGSTTEDSHLTKTKLNDGLKVLWNKEDKVKLFSAECPEGQELGINELSDDCTAAVFSSETAVYGSPRYAIYPSSAVKSFDASKGEAVLDLSEAMASPLCTSLEKDEALTEETVVSALPMAAKSEGSLFSFRNLFGALSIRVYDYARYGFEIKSISLTSRDGKAISGDATVSLENGSVTGFSGNPTATRELTQPSDIDTYGWTSWSTHSNSTFTSHARSFLFFLPAGSYPEGFDIKLICTDGRGYTFSSGAVEIEGGKVLKLERHPLTAYYGTSNCVLAAPGTASVRFDVTPYCSFSSRFEREDIIVVGAAEKVVGTKILYQAEHGSRKTDFSSSAADGTVIPSGASIALENEGGHLFMTVPLTGKAGNAAVALLDDSGEILWSFHIWVSEVSDVECSSTQDGSFAIMDRNLGATSALDRSQCSEEEVRNSFGLFYQWGRKDPFPRALSTSARSQSGDFALNSSVVRANAAIGSIGYTVKNPTARLYYNTANGCNWLMSYINDLWGSGFADASTAKVAQEDRRAGGVKTAFDPCPEGYRVPELRYLDDILSLNEGKLVSADRDRLYGYRLDTGASTTYFPAAGYISSAKDGAGSLTNEGYWCMYWTNSSAVLNAPYLFAEGTGKLSWKFGVRGHLLPVRCLREK